MKKKNGYIRTVKNGTQRLSGVSEPKLALRYMVVNRTDRLKQIIQ